MLFFCSNLRRWQELRERQTNPRSYPVPISQACMFVKHRTLCSWLSRTQLGPANEILVLLIVTKNWRLSSFCWPPRWFLGNFEKGLIHQIIFVNEFYSLPAEQERSFYMIPFELQKINKCDISCMLEFVA